MAGKEITIPSGASPLQAYLALPEGPGPHPGVVVSWQRVMHFFERHVRQLPSPPSP